ncbi:hypothetical protein N7468_010404 [Penicillium chermesinum]|uniref:Altered inheritance of mitochondria protein 24, mitochondrial n=1 Tax=Penicillium chermesinum TaxID=63820 RepID=A0A9W9NCL8_9EURO|nr:uncharacterized protein N7468_010404 [Penicillium chermesinum]KAJ5217396.1 hypothetical protein N7468_010404 [Penicillium chermesinum]
MRPAFKSRLRPLSWTRVVPRAHRHARWVQIRAAPTGQANRDQLPLASITNSAESRDARFDVIGAPYSLLSVSLSASQNLYTRRGTLVGLSGKADNVVSTLSVLEPFRRVATGVPFLYQKVSSASPVTALISVRNPTTSFAVVELDGSVDWMVAQRQALLAWTGRSLSIKPTINTSLSLAHWGSSEVTGRGLVALVGNGQVYSVELKEGEQYIAHPSNVVAYTMTSNSPRRYRFKSTTLNFQVPGLRTLPRLFQSNKYIQDISASKAWKSTMRFLHKLRTWSRMTIWGDRLFLQFDGPTTVLVQTRGPRLNDIVSEQQVNEIADAPRGITQSSSSGKTEEGSIDALVEKSRQEIQGISHSLAQIRPDGTVKADDASHSKTV